MKTALGLTAAFLLVFAVTILAVPGVAEDIRGTCYWGPEEVPVSAFGSRCNPSLPGLLLIGSILGGSALLLIRRLIRS